MIRIKTESEDGRYRIELEGHAGYAEEGRDIVCAGISTLYYTLLNRMIDVQEQTLSANVSYNGVPEMEKSYIEIEYEDYIKPEIRIIWDTMMLGFRMMAEQYSRWIKMKEN